MSKIAGVILSGGQSLRMGENKSLLKLANETLLERCEQLFIDSGISNVFISGKQGIKDDYIQKGPLAGILASLVYLKKYSLVLFIPVDMPLLTKEIILELQQYQTETITHFENFNLPLIIKNTETIRKLITAQIQSNALSIYQLHKISHSKVIKHNYTKELFSNANTPEQWQEILYLIK